MSPKPPRPRYSRRQFGKLALRTLASVTPLIGACTRPGRVSNNQGPPATGRASEPHERGDTFLNGQSRRIIDSACLRSGQSAGRFRNSTPHDVHVPGGNMGYPAFWVRDAVMMLGGDFISAKEVEGWISLMCAALRGPAAWEVHPGVVVPAYAIPDHISFDGRPTFFPGTYDTGEKQGGHPWGELPPLDDNFYFITAVYEHWRLARDLRLFRSLMRTSFSGEPLCEICEKVYQVPLSEAKTGLVMAGDVERENAKDWGFCDSVFKSGKLLFPSLLKIVAARQLAELFAAAGQPEKAAHFRRDAERVSLALEPTFLQVSGDGSEGWLHSATEVGNQPDVWGSAFAVHCGVLNAAAADRVSRALIRAFRERTAVREGLIRHIPTTDPLNGGGWQKSESALGEYQNGGYWGTPTGWYIAAIHRCDPAASAALAKEYIHTLRSNLRPDGMTEAWEWRNPDTGKSENPLYVATVALPYLSLKQAGLLSLLHHA